MLLHESVLHSDFIKKNKKDIEITTNIASSFTKQPVFWAIENIKFIQDRKGLMTYQNLSNPHSSISV